MMKKILFLFGLLVCLAGMPLTAFADNKTAKQTYETAISDNWKTMLKNSIALDTINAENNTHLLEWQDVMRAYRYIAASQEGGATPLRKDETP